MCIKFEEPKIHHSKRNTRFIQKIVKKKKIERSYQVGNLKMQPKKRIILQDKSLEVWFKRNEHTNN